MVTPFDERLELVAGVRKALAGAAGVVAAAADADTERTLDLARRALGTGSSVTTRSTGTSGPSASGPGGR
jgi:dihydrodipicolinate synthase/N-acetylneuraminate lyase